jgi:predicted RNA-binding protein YlqC (UPF0109 family)
MDSPIALQEFLQYAVMQLIEHCDKASISHELDRGKHVFHVIVDETDVGKIIGKNGYTISAIRSLLLAAAARNHTKVILKVEGRKGGILGVPTEDSEN